MFNIPYVVFYGKRSTVLFETATMRTCLYRQPCCVCLASLIKDSWLLLVLVVVHNIIYFTYCICSGSKYCNANTVYHTYEIFIFTAGIVCITF